MKVLIIASKDIKTHLKRPSFIFSIFLSSLAIIGPRIFFDYLDIAPVALPPVFLVNLMFTFTLPCLGLALLLSNADILARERSEGTTLILFSQPVSNFSIIMGKFIAILFSSLIFALLNTLFIKILHPYIWEIRGFLSEGQLLSSFFLAALIFQLPIAGLTLLFSSIFKRSVIVPIIVIFIYQILAIIYSSHLVVRLPAKFVVRHELIQIFIILLGSIFGYTLYALGEDIPVRGMAIEEPTAIKYMPINVNAQRLFYFLTSPDPGIETFEVAISIFSLTMITAITLFLSLLIIRRARSEYLE